MPVPITTKNNYIYYNLVAEF